MKFITNTSAITLVAALCLLLLPSCNDLDLVPEDTYGINILDNPEGTNLIINAAYRELALYPYYGRSFIYCSDLTSDDSEYIIGETAFPIRIALEDFAWTPTSDHNADVYGVAFTSISVCNRLLDVATDDNPTAIGQALYLRALNYFNLARMYGGVPLFLSQDVPIETFRTAARNSLDEVYDQILLDLNRVINDELLPRSWPERETGRATEWAARALLAKVYLTLASPGTDYQGSKSGFWEQSLEQSRFIRDEGPFELEAEVNRLWNPAFEYTNSEVIFDLGANGIDQFLGGIPGRYTTSTNPIDRAGWEFGWGNNVPTRQLYDAFDPADQRREAGFVTSFIAGEELTRERFERVGQTDNYNSTGDIRVFAPGDTVPFAFWQEPRIQRPHLGKYRFYGANSTPGSNVDDNNYIVFRYAEVLLMLAEAANEVNGPDGEAYEAVNTVLRRAYRGSTEFDLPTGLNRESFRTRLQNERWKELHHEGKRWWDLTRWGIYQSRMAQFGKSVQAFQKVYPLPQAEIDRNSNLAQNPGY